MNNVQSFINQQLGFGTWNHYDMALKRLTCRNEEEFTSLLPQNDINEHNPDPPIFACKFAHVKGYQNILALANEDGKIAIYNVENTLRFGRGAHNNAIFDIAWMPKAMKLVTASGDHTASLFDINNGHIHCERSFQGHIRSLKSVACRNDDNSVFATGGRDGKVIIWDARASQGDVVSIPDILVPMSHFPYGKYDFKSTKMRDCVSASSSVTGLIFKDYNSIVSCGAGDGLIKVWDIRKTHYCSNKAPMPKYTLPYCGNTLRNGFSNLLLNSDGTKLYASCLDNVVYVYNVATYDPKPIMKYVGHKNSTFYVKASISPDDKYILSGSSDNRGYIWNVENPTPLVMLTGHEAEVTCVAWCEDGSNVLITCSDDLRHKIWRVDIEVVPENMKNNFYNRAVEMCPDADYVSLRKRKHVYTIGNSYVPNINGKISYDEFFSLCEDSNTTEKVTTFSKKRTKLEILRKRKYLKTIDQNVPENGDYFKPKRLKFSSEVEDLIINDLPNFVIDGSAPHLYVSPEKKQERDWLTKLRMRRASVTHVHELSRMSPSKMPKLENGASSRSKIQKIDTAPIPTSHSPILKYFKKTSSTSQSCRAKSPNCVSLSPKSQSSQ